MGFKKSTGVDMSAYPGQIAWICNDCLQLYRRVAPSPPPRCVERLCPSNRERDFDGTGAFESAVHERNSTEVKRMIAEAIDEEREKIKAEAIATYRDVLKKKVGGLFLVVDESEVWNEGTMQSQHWWEVYMCGVKVFGSTDEAQADAFRGKLHDYMTRALGLRA